MSDGESGDALTALTRDRAGARRRHAWRTGAMVAVLVVVVGGVAIGGAVWAGRHGASSSPALSGPTSSGPAGPQPSPAGTVVTMADWPAQFSRCGQPADEVLPDLGGPATLAVDPTSATSSADEGWRATVTVGVPNADDDAAVVWGTDLTVVRDGVVVGVQDGQATPDLSQDLSERLNGGAFPTTRLPALTDVAARLTSCDQYPSGRGATDLAPGTYDLVVTQTLSYAPTTATATAAAASPGEFQDVRISARTTVTITAPEVTTPGATAPPATADPTACGTPASTLDALADPRSNPAPLALTADPHPSPYGYANYPITPTLTNTGTETLTGFAATPVLVLTQGGVVVATTAHRTAGAIADFSAASGRSIDYPDPVTPPRCPGLATPSWGGDGVPAGDYQLRIVLEVVLTEPTPATWWVATGPMDWTVSAPQVVPPDPDATPAMRASATP